jgi:hypothetical protein
MTGSLVPFGTLMKRRGVGALRRFMILCCRNDTAYDKTGWQPVDRLIISLLRLIADGAILFVITAVAFILVVAGLATIERLRRK